MGPIARTGLAVVVVLLAIPAAAEDKATARQAYAEGSRHYDLNQYAEALEAFKRAYWNYEDPVILFNIAQCHRLLKHKAEAVDFYRSYLRKAPSARNRDEVQKVISDLESAIEKDKAISTAPPQGTMATEPKPPEPPPIVVVQPPPAPAPEKTEKPVWKRAWVWGVVAGVLVAGVAVGVGVGLGAQSHPPRASDGTVSF